MLCEKCGKNEANVYIKNIVNGKVTEQHLCSACAGESGAFKTASPFSTMGGIFDGMEQAFQGFFPDERNRQFSWIGEVHLKIIKPINVIQLNV